MLLITKSIRYLAFKKERMISVSNFSDFAMTYASIPVESLNSGTHLINAEKAYEPNSYRVLKHF
jgi:hypothetical protein